jgi:hypothetical protein
MAAHKYLQAGLSKYLAYGRDVSAFLTSEHERLHFCERFLIRRGEHFLAILEVCNKCNVLAFPA